MNLYEHTFGAEVNAKPVEPWKVDTIDLGPVQFLDESAPVHPYVEGTIKILDRPITDLGAPLHLGDNVNNSPMPAVVAATIDGKVQFLDNEKGKEDIDEVIKNIVPKRTPFRHPFDEADHYTNPRIFFDANDTYNDKVWHGDGEDLSVDKLRFDPTEPAEVKAHNYTFNEDVYLEEALKYIDTTYSSHYSGKVQATEVIFSGGFGVGFCVGDIIKYAARLGKKDGYNRKDVLKIIHYATMLLYVLDNETGDKNID